VTLATQKTPQRRALELPYKDERARSIEARMVSKGVQPKGLDQLLAWFRDLIADEVPVALHKRGLWYDHGQDASGGSKLGTPAWSDPFRRFIEGVDHPSALNDDGFYLWPLRAALSRMDRDRKPLTARMLFQLALLGGDWHRLADQMCYPIEIMELTIERALMHCWREYSSEGRLT
jgi:hypothetical protein